MSNETKKHYRHFTVDERKLLEKMYKSHSPIEIAYLINKDQATVYRELERCKGNYRAKEAQENHIEKISNRYRYARRKQQASKADRKQIETCIMMKPTINKEEVIRMTKLNKEIVETNFDIIRKQVMTSV